MGEILILKEFKFFEFQTRFKYPKTGKSQKTTQEMARDHPFSPS
jgi:hypothetical protein